MKKQVNIARMMALYHIVKCKGQQTQQGRAAWRVYTKHRLRAGLCHLAVPAALQERWKRSEWPYDRPGELLSETLDRKPDTILAEGVTT